MILWTVAHQAPLSMELSRQEYWSGLSCPPPGHLPYPGIELESSASSALQADSLPLSYQKGHSILEEMAKVRYRDVGVGNKRCFMMWRENETPIHLLLRFSKYIWEVQNGS